MCRKVKVKSPFGKRRNKTVRFYSGQYLTVRKSLKYLARHSRNGVGNAKRDIVLEAIMSAINPSCVKLASFYFSLFDELDSFLDVNYRITLKTLTIMFFSISNSAGWYSPPLNVNSSTFVIVVSTGWLAWSLNFWCLVVSGFCSFYLISLRACIGMRNRKSALRCFSCLVIMACVQLISFILYVDNEIHLSSLACSTSD